VNGILWIFSEKVIVSLLSFIATFWYAKILGPAGFGSIVVVLAIAQFISGVLGNIQNASLMSTGADQIREDYPVSLWGWLIVTGVISLILLFILLKVYSEFSWYLLALVVVYIPLTAIGKGYIAYSVRKQEFKNLAKRTLVGKVIGIACGLLLAFNGSAAAAVVAQVVVAYSVSLVSLVFLTDYENKLRFNISKYLRLVVEGVPSGVRAMEAQFRERGVIVLIGIFLGSELAGFYAVAMKFVNFPEKMVNNTFTTFSQPLFLSASGKKGGVACVYKSLQFFVCFLLLPIFVVLICLSSNIVGLFFDPEWNAAANIMVVLSAIYFLVTPIMLVPPLQMVVKRTEETYPADIISMIVIIMSVVLLGGIFGVYSAILGMFISSVILIYFYIKSLLSISGKSAKYYLTEFVCIAVSCCFMAGAIYTLKHINWFESWHYQWVFGGVVYLGALYLFDRFRFIDVRGHIDTLSKESL